MLEKLRDHIKLLGLGLFIYSLSQPFISPAFAVTVTVETTIYEIDGDDSADFIESDGADRSIPSIATGTEQSRAEVAQFGPFHIVAADRAELIGSIESDTPAQFRKLMLAFPDLRQIDMIDCPGTGDDEANLALARMIRKAGLTTHVPDGGSVRSGGVELFLAGVQRIAGRNAEFAVHSWRDEDGLEADDFGAQDPVHKAYIAYYTEMGMSEDKARAFYEMTNSAPYDDALYIKASDISAYLKVISS